MIYEQGVLRDLVTELRVVQVDVNTKKEFTSEDMDRIAEALNRAEMLVLSILGSQIAGGQPPTGVPLNIESLSAQILKQRMAEEGGEVVLPEDDLWPDNTPKKKS